jgi:hypothetical protein
MIIEQLVELNAPGAFPGLENRETNGTQLKNPAAAIPK